MNDNQYCVCLFVKIFLEEYKYALTKKKIMNAINIEPNLMSLMMYLIMIGLLNLIKNWIVF